MIITVKNYQIQEATVSLSKFPGLQNAALATERLAKIFEVLKTTSIGIEEKRKTLWDSIFGELREVSQNDPRVSQYNKNLESLLQEENKINVVPIKKDDLNLNINAVPPADLANISFLIVDWV